MAAPRLDDLVAPEAVALDRDVADWEEAIRASGRLLEDTGVAEAEYTEAMVRSVHENGPYIVLAPGFAFAHARPSDAVHRTGMSWVRLAAPVEFGHRTNDPVSLVVALAATDSSTHQQAMGSLAALLADPAARSRLDAASSPEELRAVLGGGDASTTTGAAAPGSEPESESGGAASAAGAGSTHDHILTVCGNGLGTSLFLKSTLEHVLDRWGWGALISVEATDTVSARGKAKDADLILTSGEIARALGDVGVPVRAIDNFTSQSEVDAALRDLYDV